MITGKPFISAGKIQAKVSELAEQISRDYKGRDLLAAGILKGAFIFFSDLVRQIQTPLTIDFIIASSYIKTSSTGEAAIHYDIKEEVAGRDILLIEDIVDTGVTLSKLRENLLAKSPLSLKICTLLDKHEKRIADIPVDYTGFQVPDKFLVGYGLDYNNQYRNLPYISIFKESSTHE